MFRSRSHFPVCSAVHPAILRAGGRRRGLSPAIMAIASTGFVLEIIQGLKTPFVDHAALIRPLFWLAANALPQWGNARVARVRLFRASQVPACLFQFTSTGVVLPKTDCQHALSLGRRP